MVSRIVLGAAISKFTCLVEPGNVRGHSSRMHSAPLEVYTLLALHKFLYPGKDPQCLCPRKASRSLAQQRWKEGVALENFPASHHTHPYTVRAYEPDPEPKGYEDTHGPLLPLDPSLSQPSSLRSTSEREEERKEKGERKDCQHLHSQVLVSPSASLPGS